jgi:hypothetical protein
MRLIFLILFFYLFGCSYNREAINERLIDFNYRYISDSDSIYNLKKCERDKILNDFVSPKYDTIIYKDNEIYISFLTMATGCSKYKGNVSFSKDTIQLSIFNTSDESCSEQNCYRLFYKVSNPDNRKFIIKKP